MTANNKILPVALVAALLGGSVGAFVMRPSKTAETPTVQSTTPAAQTTDTALALKNLAPVESTESSALNASSDDRAAFREGFAEGVRAAREEELATQSSATRTRTVTPTRTAYRSTATRARTVRANNSRQVYYDYEQPRKRSFWSKHRDKLTVAAGAGGGAIIGGLIGGKKGAAIGALAGGGGSALYTYKIRKRDRRY